MKFLKKFLKRKNWLVIYFTKEGPIEKYFKEFQSKEIVFAFNGKSQKNETFTLIYKNQNERISVYTLEV